jgi:hypothetical protein
MEQNTRPKSKINPHSYNHLIFDKGTKKHTLKKKTASLTNGAGETGYPHAKN